jgi:hypothetical protein
VQGEGIKVSRHSKNDLDLLTALGYHKPSFRLKRFRDKKFERARAIPFNLVGPIIHSFKD